MHPDKLRILYVEDIETDVEYISRVLRKSNITFDLQVVSSKDSYIAALCDFLPDLILSDHNLPDINSLEALDILKKTGILIPFILVTGTVSEEFAAQVILKGADDYILKDRPERLPIAIKNVLEKFRIEKEQRNSEEKLSASEKRFRAMIEKSADMITLASTDEIILYVSPSVTKLLGYSQEEFLGLRISALCHPDDLARLMSSWAGLINKPFDSLFFEQRFLHKNGSYSWFEGSVTNLLHDPAVGALVSNIRDITERKLAEEKLTNANLMYAFISHINQAIVHTVDEQALFNVVCQIAVVIGKFDLACIDTLDEPNKKLNLIAQNNVSPAFIDLFSSIEYPENGAIAKVLRHDKYYIVEDYSKEPEQNFWRQYAFTSEFKSAISIPLKKSHKIHYILSLFSKNTHAFNRDEIKLLEEAAMDISFALDIFEQERHRRQMQDKVAESEQRLQVAQAIAHFGNWKLDFSTGVIECSEETCRIYGISFDNNLLSQKEWLAFIHPDDLDYVMKVTNESHETLSNISFHHRIVRRDGTTRYIFSHTHFELNAEGKPFGLYGVAHDETETKEAVTALAHSEANLRLIVDTIPQCLFAKDYNGKFVFVNRSFAALYGLAKENLVNELISKIIPVKSEADNFISEDQEVITSGKINTIGEHVFTDSLGAKRIFSTVKIPFTIIGTNEKAVLGISMDITNQKKHELKIETQNKRLREISHIQSHEVRNHVATIKGLMQFIDISKMEDNESAQIFTMMKQSVENLDKAIHDINERTELLE